ncbi:MAG TPA: type I DNA topoisomerase, partial [Rhodospirillaceae bacterium]|nr:type I DNA topoisomerase [Rhodospirillaceae bacterium]
KHVKDILAAAKGAKAIYLATDPDREGEAISWHIEELLNEKKLDTGREIHRVTFNEITKTAIQAAFNKPRAVNAELVEAYLARRALDYLVGFNISPLLWRKLPGSKSAGRVQSVALRLICEREDEIEKFKAEEYWTIEATIETEDGTRFPARLTHFEGQKLEKFSITDEANARRIAAALEGQAFTVTAQTRKEVKRNPSPPFITSSMQMEASRKLGIGAQQTMRLAQQLYEGVDIGGETVGLITYMRTDGVQLSEEAIGSCRSMIDQLYGQTYLPGEPRVYTTKAKNAQEAHEAIRPTDLHRSPDAVKKYLNSEQLALYEMIWMRTLAAQMESAIMDQAAIDFTGANNATLRATGSVIKFDGFLKVYSEGKDETPEEDDENRRLPELQDGAKVKTPEITPDQHFTQPPPRYSEATLVKAMEELGIGRPSTYASIINVLQERSYVRIDKKRFIPEDRGRVVTSFLQNFFKKYVQYDFTADLEGQLDDVSAGKLNWKKLLREFWGDFSAAIEEAKPLTITQVIDVLDAELEAHLFPPRNDGTDPRKCPLDGGRLGLKLGRYGAFIGCSHYPECEFKKPLSVGVGGANGEGGEDSGPRILGPHPDNGEDIEVKIGPYGPYVEMPGAEGKPKRSSLPRGMSIADMTLEKAIELLRLPREVGIFPETGETITANVGRFGPFVQAGKIYASVPKDEDILTIGLNRAITLLMDKKEKMKPLRILGEHPEGGEIGIYTARFGHVVRHGNMEANLARVIMIDDVTLEEAIALLAEKGRPRLGTKVPKKKPAKKAAAKKPAVKKPAAKKAAKISGKRPAAKKAK